MKCLERKSQKKSLMMSPSMEPTVGRSNTKGLGICTTFNCLPRSFRYRNVRRREWSTDTAVERRLSVLSVSWALSASACFLRSSRSPTNHSRESVCQEGILTYHRRKNQKPASRAIFHEGHPRLRSGYHQLAGNRLRP